MGSFRFIETGIAGLTVVEPTVSADSRGYFMETYRQQEFADAGIHATFVQDNQSASSKGVLRGLHFQKQHPQGKLVRAVSGTLFDVAVDLRPRSATFGRWYGVTLSAENKRQLYVPEGFAHGFLVLSESAEFFYKCTDTYAPGDEGGIPFDDPDIGVAWPALDVPYLTSDKDRRHLAFAQQDFSYFERW